jgi:hypothetical protein
MVTNFFEFILAIKAKFAKPENWIQNEFATDCNGIGVDYGDEKACKFCLMGALRKICYDYNLNDIYYIDKFGELLYEFVNTTIITFNDTTTYEKLMLTLDAMLEKVKEEYA